MEPLKEFPLVSVALDLDGKRKYVFMSWDMYLANGRHAAIFDHDYEKWIKRYPYEEQDVRKT